MIESYGLIINKIDLLSSVDIDELKSGFNNYLTGKKYLLQSALSIDDIETTYNFINRSGSMFNEDLSFDSDLHHKALDRLKWNEEVHILEDKNNVRNDIEKLISKMLSHLKKEQSTIAHIKILIETGDKTMKLSITSLDLDNWRKALYGFNSKKAKITINSRTQSL